MPFYQIQAVLQTPCCISDRPLTGNEIRTLDYIPGSALRGVFAAAYLQNGNCPVSNKAEFQTLFHGQVTFPNLYPQSSQPLPLSAYTCKWYPGYARLDGKGVWDLLFEELDALTRSDAGIRNRRYHEGGAYVSPLQPLGPGWFQLSHKQPAGVSAPRQSLRLRTAVASSGSAQSGGLYSEEELEADTRFAGRMYLPDKATKDRLLTGIGLAAEGGDFVGLVGRHRAGQLSRSGSKSHDSRQPDEAIFQLDGGPARWIAMTLRSDVILVDQALRPVTAIDYNCQVLSRYADDVGHLQQVRSLRLHKAFVGSRRISGWNLVARLPKPDDVAISKGSCFLLQFDAADEPSIKQWMSACAEQGIGLRRSEGFGAVTFHHDFHDAARRAHLEGRPL